MARKKKLTQKEIDMMNSFEVMTDTMTAMLQLEGVMNTAMVILKKKHGEIIPKMGKEDMIEVLLESVQREF